ncbi:hypothetical protein BGZ93_010131 [Podila epicladia]|nr:hypothetical protein BGZ92_007635 [Podila epicladia]KAG0088916.1 hypothetical protein BGZ93_010131 [Podila epicladia]
MFAPQPSLLKGVFRVLDGVSKLTSLPEEGKGPWVQDKDSKEQYDYVILGGGTAGCVLASRLAETPGVKVLILEAGYSDDVFSSKAPASYMMKFDTSDDWNFVTVPQAHAGNRVMKQPRGKLLGGTSAINAMMYHRGARGDYDEWESFGNPDWSYQDCLPYFKKSEGFNDPDLPATHAKGPMTSRVRKTQYETHDPAYHGTEGPWQVTFHNLFGSTEGFIRANVAEGVAFNKDFNGETTLGVNRIQTFIQRDAVRSSLSRAFLKPKGIVPGGGARGTIRVVYGANIQRVLVQMCRGVKMAYGVEFVDHNNAVRQVRAVREVLLCGGAFGSPHLLLASGIGPTPQPSIPHIHTLPGVGANLQDHLGLGVVFRARNCCETMQQGMAYGSSLKTLFNYVLRGVGPLSSQVGEAANFVRLDDIAPEFVAREKANGTYKEMASGPSSPHLEIIFAPFYVRKHGTIMAPDAKIYYTLIALLLNPASSGSVKIAPKKTKRGNLEWETVIDPNYYSDSFDARVMAEAVRFIRKLGRRLNQDPELGGREVYPGEEVIPDSDEQGLQQFARESSETYYHPTTTAKMGPGSDKMAVVDSRLNVHGIERLRVADASVFPKIPAAHTCAPTVMVAEKCADYIKEDWQDSDKKEPTVARL